MVERSAAMAAEAMDGRVIGGDPATRWRGAAIDSRRVAGREIFFALPGDRVDGHDFARDAVRRGAATVVVHRDLEPSPDETAWVRVDDTFEALHALTRAVRGEVPRHLLGLTGSVGKTTTKELLARILARRFTVEGSLGNFNNTYGFPLALLNIDDGCEWMVAEMGMSTPGELGQVSRLGRPDVALLLNVRPVHLENFGDLDAIARAKGELLDGLVRGGLIVANADDPLVERLVRRYVRDRDPSVRVVRYGAGVPADVRATPAVPLGGGRVGSRFEVTACGKTAGDETVAVELPVHGLYNAENALAAAACAWALGMPLAEIAAAVAGFSPPAGRGEVHRLTGGVTLIDDTYNSNPDAAGKALASARQFPGERHVAVLGDMLELGDGAAAFHAEAGERAAELGFDPVVGVGDLARTLVAAAGRRGATAVHFSTASQAAAGIPGVLHAGDVVLVKGSRGVALEAVVEALIAKQEEGD